MIKAKNEKQVMEAFVSPHGQIIKQFLQECSDDMTQRLKVADKGDFQKAQGAVQELDEIIGLANNAKSVLHS